MRILPTTQTLVNKIKAEGRAIARASGIPLGQGHDEAARRAGYDDFHHVRHCLTQSERAKVARHARAPATPEDKNETRLRYAAITAEYERNPRAYFAYLQSLGLSPVTHNPLKGKIFIDLTIEGQRFQAILDGGPGPIVVGGHFLSAWVQYGVSSIARAGSDGVSEDNLCWAVCKYGGQYRIGLPSLTPAGIRALAVEMGLVIRRSLSGDGPLVVPLCAESSPPDELKAFFNSKAFDALVEWARAHPRKIKQYGQNTYTFDWASRAAAAARQT